MRRYRASGKIPGRTRWLLSAALLLTCTCLPTGCGSQPVTTSGPDVAPFELQVKFANVDENMRVLTAVATLSPGDATHVTLDFWDIEMDPADAYRPVGHVSKSGQEGLGIAVELYSGAPLTAGSYVFGSEYPECCVPSITYGGVEYQLAPHPQYVGRVQLDAVDLTEGGLVRGYLDLQCYYGEIVRGPFTALVHLR